MPENAVFAVVNDANGDIDFLRNLFSKLPQAVSNETEKKLDLIALIGNTPGSQMSTEELKEFDERAWQLLCDEFNANREGWQKKKVMNAADLGSIYAVDPCGNPASKPFRHYIGAVDTGGIPVEGILVPRFRKFYRDLGEAMRTARGEGIKVKVMGNNIFQVEALSSDSYLDWQKVVINRLGITSSGLDEITDAADAPLLAYRSGKSIEEDEALKSTFFSDMKESGVIICNSNIPSKERLMTGERYMIIAGQKNPIAHGKIAIRESNYLPSKIFDEIAHKLPHSPVGVYVFDGRAGAHLQFVWHTETGAFQKASKHNFRLHEDADAEQTRNFSGERVPIRPPDADTPPPVPSSEPAHFSQPEAGQGTRPLALEARIQQLEGQLAAAEKIQGQLEDENEAIVSRSMRVIGKVKRWATERVAAAKKDADDADAYLMDHVDVFTLVKDLDGYVTEKHPEFKGKKPVERVLGYLKWFTGLGATIDELRAKAQEGLSSKARVSELEQQIGAKNQEFESIQSLYEQAVEPLAKRLKAICGGRIQAENPRDILEQVAGLVQSGEFEPESDDKLKQQYEAFERQRVGYEQSAAKIQEGHKKAREADKKEHDAEIERLTSEQVTQLNSRNDDVDSAREERDQEKEKALNLERTAERKQKEHAALEQRLETAATELEALRKGQPDAGELSKLRQGREADKQTYDTEIAAKQKEIDSHKTELETRRKKLEHADKMFGAVAKIIESVAPYLKTRFGNKLVETDPMKVLVEFKTKALKAGDEPGAGEIEKRIAEIEAQRAALEQENNKLKGDYATAQTSIGQVKNAAELQLTEVRKGYDEQLAVKVREYAALEQRRQTSEQKYGKAVEDRTDLEERLKKTREEHGKALGEQRTGFEKQLGDARKQYEADLKRAREEKGEPDTKLAAKVTELEQKLEKAGKDLAANRKKMQEAHAKALAEKDKSHTDALTRKDTQREAMETQYRREVGKKDQELQEKADEILRIRRNAAAPDDLVAIVRNWASAHPVKAPRVNIPKGARFEKVLEGMRARIEKNKAYDNFKEPLLEAYDAMLHGGGYAKRINNLKEVIGSNACELVNTRANRELRTLVAVSRMYLGRTSFAKNNPKEYALLCELQSGLPLGYVASLWDQIRAIENDKDELEGRISRLHDDYNSARSIADYADKALYASTGLSGNAKIRKLQYACRNYRVAREGVPFDAAKQNCSFNIGMCLALIASETHNEDKFEEALSEFKLAPKSASRKDWMDYCKGEIKFAPVARVA